jgi:hypothetical protein
MKIKKRLVVWYVCVISVLATVAHYGITNGVWL